MRNRARVAIVSTFVTVAAWLPPAAAEDGVTADRILFGQSAALTGPAAELRSDAEIERAYLGIGVS